MQQTNPIFQILITLILTTKLSAGCVCGACGGCSTFLPALKANVKSVKLTYDTQYKELGAYYYNNVGRYIKNININQRTITSLQYQINYLNQKILEQKLSLSEQQKIYNQLQKQLNILTANH